MSRPKLDFPEPKLKKKTNGVFWVEWTDSGKTRRESTGTRDEREARICFNRKTLELLTPSTPKSRMTVEEVCDFYLASKNRDGADTISMKTSLRAIKKKLGVAYYDMLTDDVMKEYVRWRRLQPRRGPEHIAMAKNNPVANGTIKREIVTLRAALKLCARQKLIDTVPSPLCPVSITASRHQYLTKDEFIRLLEASKDTPHINLYLQIALLTGQRRMAILHLKWRDVELDQLQGDMIISSYVDELEKLNLTKAVKITFGDGVGNKRKAPPIEIRDEMLLHALHRAYIQRKSDYVIEWHGKPVKDIKTGLRRACERAGVKTITTHVMRHTTISWLISAGVSSTVVAKRVNVSQEIIDRHYAHLSPEIQQEAEKILSVNGVASMNNVV